jgi:lipoprotein-releasing system permease protein
VLIVSVVQKSKEIGILRAMGASRGQILRVFCCRARRWGLATARRLRARRAAIGALGRAS